MVWKVRGQGPQHRSDDVSRVPPQNAHRSGITGTVTSSGSLIPTTSPELWFSLNLARRIREYRNLIAANTTVQIAFDTTCVGIEVVNDTSTASSVGVAFGSDTPSTPANSATIQASSEVKSGEARFYDVKVDQVSIHAGATASQVRVTVALP